MYEQTFATMSFKEILSQAMETLGVSLAHWSGGSTIVFTIYGKNNLIVNVKHRESAPIHALVYIDEVLGYKIRDVNYIRYLMKHSEI
jgi:hypothetical protein